MALTSKEVEHVARLARLALADAEKENLRDQLDHILRYVEKLKELDTTKVPVTSHPFASKTVWREDHAKGSGLKERILGNAPESEDGLFKVKKVIE